MEGFSHPSELGAGTLHKLIPGVSCGSLEYCEVIMTMPACRYTEADGVPYTSQADSWLHGASKVHLHPPPALFS